MCQRYESRQLGECAMKIIKVIAKSLFVLLLFVSVYPARAQSTDADFELAVIEYQRLHTTSAAAEVIKLAKAMAQLPLIPEEARRHFVRGSALFKDAASPDDFAQVHDEFKQATDLAPWWPEARYNWALACEAAGDYAEAIGHLNLYLLFRLPEAEARIAQDKIYALEAKQEKAAKNRTEESRTEVVGAREEEDFAKKLDGARYLRDDHTALVEIRGTEAVFSEVYAYDNRWHAIASAPVSGPGREIKLTPYEGVSGLDVILIINPDGESVLLKFPSLQGLRKDLILQRER
jgi:hypothetical protein